jgi:glucose-1-phosphate adenylyltransferase
VYQHTHYIEECGSELILILAADHIYKMDYGKMLDFHQEADADVTVGVTSVPIMEAHRFGITSRDVEGRIVDFAEKPEIPQSNLASMGIYTFSKQALLDRLKEDAAELSSPHDFGHAIIPRMIEKDNVFAYRFNGYWRDIGNIRAYYTANMDLTCQTPSFCIDDNGPVSTMDDNTIPPKISGEVRQSIISPGCVIKGQVVSSVLSPGVWVEEKAMVKDSLIMSSTFVGRHSVIDHCILDEQVSIGKFCYIGFGTSPVLGDWDITVVGKNTTVPSYTAIGHGCKVLPNTGLADFTTRAIPPDSVVSPQTMTQLINTLERTYTMPIK